MSSISLETMMLMVISIHSIQYDDLKKNQINDDDDDDGGVRCLSFDVQQIDRFVSKKKSTNNFRKTQERKSEKD